MNNKNSLRALKETRMKSWSKKFGFISIEAIIVASIILGVGILGMASFQTTASAVAQNSVDNLDGLNLFGQNLGIEYDELGYPASLNVNSVEVNPETDFEFMWNDSLNGWTITAYPGGDSSLIIPSKNADGQPIVEIGEYAFMYKNLTSVAIPNTIKSIKSGAFYDNMLSELVLPNSITTVSEQAFQWNQLTSITLPNNLEVIEKGVFSNNKLAAIDLPDSIIIIKDYAFSENELIEISVPKNVKTIESMAFSRNTITKVMLNEGLENIGNSAFSNNEIKSFIFPESLKTAGSMILQDNPIETI